MFWVVKLAFNDCAIIPNQESDILWLVQKIVSEVSEDLKILTKRCIIGAI